MFDFFFVTLFFFGLVLSPVLISICSKYHFLLHSSYNGRPCYCQRSSYRQSTPANSWRIYRQVCALPRLQAAGNKTLSEV